MNKKKLERAKAVENDIAVLIAEKDACYYPTDPSRWTKYMKLDYYKQKVRYFNLVDKLDKVRKFVCKIDRFLTEKLPKDYNQRADQLIMHTDYYIAVK
jgi:hypothetical protein